jgi:PPOX class probable F420-dependent enzyme
MTAMPIPIPGNVWQLLDAPNYVYLPTLRAGGSPRNWVVWAGLEDDHILVYTTDAIWKAKDLRRDPRVALSVTDMANPYRMAAIQGRVVEVLPDKDCRYTDLMASSACACRTTRPAFSTGGGTLQQRYHRFRVVTAEAGSPGPGDSRSL